MIRFITALVLAAFALATQVAQAAVDANKASQAELETVKGIGPGLSGKILNARKSGDFKDWNDLVDRVGGIGSGNASKFSQAGLTVGGGAYAGVPAADVKSTKTANASKGEQVAKADKPAKIKADTKAEKKPAEASR